MEIHSVGIFDNRLLRSLSTIQAANIQLRLLTTSNSTPTVLVSQIGLCDVLLDEIRAIRLSLERRLRQRGSVCGVIAAKRNRSHEGPVLPSGSSANRARQGRYRAKSVMSPN
jgi:hypothetical protein